VPGASGLVWPPQTRALPDRIVIEDRLVQATATSLRRQGAKLAQALLSADEQTLACSLERNGFEHITSLWYLRHDLSRPAAFLPTGRLKYRTYHEAGRTLFHSILLRTYENTDDCPEVNGVRTIDEIIAGHLAQGRHDPDRWWLAMHDGQPVGVLLVAEVTDTRAWDIAYVGVVPEARHRGYGREMTHMAMEAARATSTEYLTLAVDNRNRAAWNLYQRLGFEPYDQREVYLAVWSQAP
jgi:ribosomal protein S18 acetylase RimI-like enzyme